MSRFNARSTRPAVHSPVTTTGEQTRTHEGATGYLRDAKSELFLLSVSNFVGQDTFYEQGGQRDDRYTQLIRQLATEDPAWVVGLLGWLRGDGNMRTASLVGAAEFVKARLDATAAGDLAPDEQVAVLNGGGWNRQAIGAVLQRADEPGEMLGYWTSKYGRKLPKPVKRGIADAVQRLYTERALLKYDTDSKGYRFGDVLNLVHASPAHDKAWQGDLFKHALDRRHGNAEDTPETLHVIRRNEALRTLVRTGVLDPLTDPEALRDAGMTWEDSLSLAGSKVDKAKLWEALIPSMGYMALLRNLRNFDEAEVSDEVAEQVVKRLADPEQVAKSRQLPMRFYSAYNAAPSLRWGHALEKALTASLVNIPTLPGRTLILVDTSSSMHEAFSRDGSLMRWDAAALFGIALGRRCDSGDVRSFSSARYYMGDPPGAKTRAFPLTAGGSVLGDVKKWRDGGWFLGGGTDTAAALRQEFAGHDRVVIVTDEQAGHDYSEVDKSIPQTTPLYTWNLAGYQAGHAPSGRGQRHTFGGLTDAAFRMVPLLEAGRDADWPWARTA
ncbi:MULTISPECIES: TROVE domain-containing protein [unclassified Streptomyces]|uniref:TROVE domain-containing protein n=1 Tax=unclassified Streptomyces TaxID=2593676 RepID=UPI00136ED69B|nr:MULTISPECIES: TROVE domain-containing protein [unclassified Streptomyces]NDZ98469.1 TROVE domain-containing protein [Streptomyces sp. SID10116]MYY79804.1 TROVE domain-containing protein [Streptomyces sp. SID335]MYZ16020.1 TROVE domain-containing protein [Streptomyces sp. SID337]NDZ84459.1 TROVE domain-containing protein [Streptomyces sp. SID10115]NEB43422.1 TROVE domain-containing protein [Streptomyces sp. SID339]